MMERIKIIFYKEVKDNVRDRRTLAGALLYPLIGPIMLAFVFTLLGRTSSNEADKLLSMPVVGAENAPALVQFLKQHGAKIKPPPADPEAAVQTGDHEVVLIIPENYQKAFSAGRVAAVQLVKDDSRGAAQPSIRRAQALLRAYSAQIGSLRLLARGVHPGVISPLAIEELNVATPQSQAANFLNMLPYFIVFSIFIGGMYLAIDATVGERERGSLEPLLINPAARSELILGKLCATLVFTAVAIIETLLGFFVMMNVLHTESLGVKISLHINTLGILFLISIPMMLLACSLQMIIATNTKGFRDALNSLSLLMMIPALPGLFLVFVPVKEKLWMMLIPIFGQQLLINQVMRGEILNKVNLFGSAIVTIAAGVLLTHFAIRMYKRESILFRRQ
jgi:sodium transport system permease protein